MAAVRRYLRYDLSYRDVEELLAERGIQVDHVTVYRWVHPTRRHGGRLPAITRTVERWPYRCSPGTQP